MGGLSHMHKPLVAHRESKWSRFWQKLRVWLPYVLITVLIIPPQFIIPTQIRAAWTTWNFVYLLAFALSSGGAFLLYFATMLSEPGRVQPFRESLVGEETRNNSFQEDSIAKTYKNYCGICENWKPLRARHCSDCGYCVVKFDHHWYSFPFYARLTMCISPFFDNCIGGTNHRVFWWFLLSQTIACAFILDTVLSYLILHHRVFHAAPAYFIYETFAALGMTVALLVSGFLFVFHTWLAVGGYTTFETIVRWRSQYKGRSKNENFDLGCCMNLVTFCCARLSPEWIYSDFHVWCEESGEPDNNDGGSVNSNSNEAHEMTPI